MRIIGHLAFAGVSLMALSAPAHAQEAFAEESISDTDIIVQARRKDESLQDVPLTVNAVSAATIEKLNIRDFKDIAAIVPGLTLSSGNRTTGSVSSLRGLNVDNTSSGNNGTVEYYQNDAPISGGIVLQAMYDVGQIEVLRGPQGTLRGRASPSGSITVTTKRPVMNEWGGYAQGTVTARGEINLNGAVNVPLIDDVLAMRVAGLIANNEGSRVNSIGAANQESSSKTRALRVTLRFTPTSNFEANASYSHMLKNSIVWDQVESAHLATGGTLAPGSTLITARDRLAVSDVPNVNRVAFDVFNWGAQWSFAGQRLNYVGSVNKQNLTSTEPLDKGDFFTSTYGGDARASNNNGTYQTVPGTMNLQNMAQASRSYPKAQSHELRLSSEDRLFGAVDYIIGGFINKLQPWSDILALTTANFAPTVAPGNFTGFSSRYTARRGRTLERAVFGNLTVHLGEATEISGGIRHINYQENLNGRNNTFKSTIWTASAKHRFSDDFMVYASAGSSFRVGSGTNSLILNSQGLDIPNVTDPYLASLLPITPETSKSYEIGLRSTFFDKKLLINVSAFHQDFSNHIFTVPGGSFFFRNVGGALLPMRSGIAVPVPVKVNGVEAEIAFRPNRNFNLSATVAYAKSKMSGVLPCGSPTGTAQVGTCAVDQSAARSAPFSASLQAEYTHPVSNDLNGFVRGLLSVNGNSKNDPINPYDDVKGFALFNLYAGVQSEDGGWEVTAYAKNLFNTFRVTDRGLSAANVSTNLGAQFSDYRLISTTDPREFGVTAKISFGSR